LGQSWSVYETKGEAWRRELIPPLSCTEKEEAEPSILFMMVNIDTIPVKCPSKKGLKSKMIAIINIGGLRIGA